MRKTFAIAVIVLSALAAASCAEPVSQMPETPQQVVLRSSSQRSVKGFVEGTTMLDTPFDKLHDDITDAGRSPRTLHLAAWHVPQSGMAEPYLAGDAFAVEADGLWHHDPAVYWPLGGTLDFLAYSTTLPLPESAAVWGRERNTDRLTVTVDSTFTQDDVLFAYAAPRGAQGGLPVSMTFYHAQAWLEFIVKSTLPTEGSVTLHRIYLEDIYTAGELLVQHPFGAAEGSWSYRFAERKDTDVDDSRGVYGTVMTAMPKYCDMLLPQQPMKDIVVEYSLEGSDMQMLYRYPLPEAYWEMGRKYIYEITFNPHGIEFLPTVVDWDAVVVPTTSRDTEVRGTGDGPAERVGADFSFASGDTYRWRLTAEDDYVTLTGGTGSWGSRVSWTAGDYTVTLEAQAGGYVWSYERDVTREPLTLEALTDGQITYVKTTTSSSETVTKPIKYSLNGGEWMELARGGSINVVAGDRVRLIGRGPYIYDYYHLDQSDMAIRGAHLRTAGGCTVNAWGNAKSMNVSEAEYAAAEVASWDEPGTVAALFYGNTGIIDASAVVLPTPKATNGYQSGLGSWSSNGYEGMFLGCTALRKAPASLPADIGSVAYVARYMFRGCISLSYPPALPAMEVGRSGYYGMFQGCIGLRETPALPATRLSERAYAVMFDGCTSLQTVPDVLPAELDDDYYGNDVEGGSGYICNNVYEGMFRGCTALRRAPALPSATVPGGSYRTMFQNCTSLTAAPALDAMTVYREGYYAMFEGCTSLSTAPSTLPATDLASSYYVYYKMFSGCTSLKVAPAIAVEGTLPSNGMNMMFYNCTALTTPPPQILATAYGAYAMSDMFYNCSSLTSGPAITVTSTEQTNPDHVFYRTFYNCGSMRTISFRYLVENVLGSNCFDETFYSCRALTSVPELSFRGVGSKACYRTFYQCQSLPDLPSLDITSLPSGGDNRNMQEMFYGCTAARTADIEITATAIPQYGCSSTFRSCEALRSVIRMATITVAQYGCDNMFYGCASMPEAPEDLVITSIADYGCRAMFTNCYVMKTVPEITATSVGSYGCNGMFANCYAITVAPDISSVTSIGQYACYQMYSNCRSLTEATLPVVSSVPNYGCYQMFYSCSSLTDLPPTFTPSSIANNGCYQMYYGCSALVTAPTMASVTSIANYGCKQMFQNCAALEYGPAAMPATSIGSEGCYQMFYECGNMRMAMASLPVTSIQSSAVREMFYKCTSLEAAPTMAVASVGYNGCYQMYYGCENMVEGPTGFGVSATGEYCCYRMFYQCYRMQDFGFSVTATSLSGSSPFREMFYQCKALTVAPELPATTLTNSCYYNMYWGCSSITTCQATLPATTLQSYCYYGMFSGTAITAAPSLPATTLQAYCYQSMFNGCQNLTAAPALPAETMQPSCYSGMFSGCYSLTTAPALPATTLAQSCYDHMFEYCRSLTVAPALPAETLAQYCYSGMFSSCTALETAPALPATTLQPYCYQSMFQNCWNLTVAPVLPAETLVNYCYYQMFYNCYRLAYVKALFLSFPNSYSYNNWLNYVATTGTFVRSASATWTPNASLVPSGWTLVSE